MRDFICDKIKKIKPSGIRRLFDIANEIPDVISLGVGEPDFDTPWHVREEGLYALQKGRTFYTSNAGLPELREEICKNIKRKYGLDYDSKNEVVVTIGGSEAIDIALRALLDPGDEVVYPEPCFVSYQPCILLSDGVPVPIPLSAAATHNCQSGGFPPSRRIPRDANAVAEQNSPAIITFCRGKRSAMTPPKGESSPCGK